MFRVSLALKSFITFHSINIVLGNTVKNTEHVIVTEVYSHLFDKMRWEFCIFWPVQANLGGTVYISQKAYKPSQCYSYF
jgi:hypothetical protein